MAYISDLTPEEELREFYDYLTTWVQAQDKRHKILFETVNIRDRRLDVREQMLNEKEKILKDIEVKLTGNSV